MTKIAKLTFIELNKIIAKLTLTEYLNDFRQYFQFYFAYYNLTHKMHVTIVPILQRRMPRHSRS